MPASFRVRLWSCGLAASIMSLLLIAVPASADPQCNLSGMKDEGLIASQTNRAETTPGQAKIRVIGTQYVTERHCFMYLQAELYAWDGNRFGLVNLVYCSTPSNNDGNSRPAQAYGCVGNFNAPRDTTLTSRTYGLAMQPHDKGHEWDRERTWWGKCVRYIGVIDYWVEWDEQTARPICDAQD